MFNVIFIVGLGTAIHSGGDAVGAFVGLMFVIGALGESV